MSNHFTISFYHTSSHHIVRLQENSLMSPNQNKQLSFSSYINANIQVMVRAYVFVGNESTGHSFTNEFLSTLSKKQPQFSCF